MNHLVEVHDSTLAEVIHHDGVVTLCLRPAYIHCSEGQPGVDLGTGWTQDMDLVISGAVLESVPLDLPKDLWDGSFSLGDQCWDNAIPQPLAFSGVVSFSANTISGERLVVRGTGAECKARGEMQYVEEYPGAG